MIREIKQDPIKYEDYWVIRVIQDCGTSKRCYSEAEYDSYPTENEVVKTLNIVPANCFVTVEHNYRLVR